MAKFEQRTFTVGATDGQAARRYAANYDRVFAGQDEPEPEPELQLQEHDFTVPPERQCDTFFVEGTPFCRRCGKVDPRPDVACSRK